RLFCLRMIGGQATRMPTVHKIESVLLLIGHRCEVWARARCPLSENAIRELILPDVGHTIDGPAAGKSLTGFVPDHACGTTRDLADFLRTLGGQVDPMKLQDRRPGDEIAADSDEQAATIRVWKDLDRQPAVRTAEYNLFCHSHLRATHDGILPTTFEVVVGGTVGRCHQTVASSNNRIRSAQRGYCVDPGFNRTEVVIDLGTIR